MTTEYDAVEPHLAAAERGGARRSKSFSAADELVASAVPVGVRSLNCGAACREALDAYGAAGSVDTVVGRDSVSERKPHPEPLLAAVEKSEAAPGRTPFVGDSASDEDPR